MQDLRWHMVSTVEDLTQPWTGHYAEGGVRTVPAGVDPLADLLRELTVLQTSHELHLGGGVGKRPQAVECSRPDLRTCQEHV